MIRHRFRDGNSSGVRAVQNVRHDIPIASASVTCELLLKSPLAKDSRCAM